MLNFEYRPTNRLMSPAEVLAERQALQSGQQRNALMQLQLQNAQAEAVQRNALMQQQGQQAQSRMGYLNDLAGNMGPPQEFNPARALAANLKPDEINLLQGPKPQAPIQWDPTKALVGFGPDGKPQVLREAQTEAPKMPTSWQEFQLALQNPEFAAHMERMKRAGAAGGVTLMAPIPVQQADGTVGYVQPGNKPGAPVQTLKDPQTGKPLTRPSDSAANKPPAEIQRMNIAIDTMSTLLNDYEALLKKHNPRDPLVQANPAIRASFQSLMKNIQLQFKEVQALGALAGPDLAIMEASITDPFTFKGAYYGKDGLLGQIVQARRLLSTRQQATSANIGGAGVQRQQPPANADPLGLRGGN